VWLGFAVSGAAADETQVQRGFVSFVNEELKQYFALRIPQPSRTKSLSSVQLSLTSSKEIAEIRLREVCLAAFLRRPSNSQSTRPQGAAWSKGFTKPQYGASPCAVAVSAAARKTKPWPRQSLGAASKGCRSAVVDSVTTTRQVVIRPKVKPSAANPTRLVCAGV